MIIVISLFDYIYVRIIDDTIFFPDWTNGLPSDLLILHFFVGAVIFPFNMIHAKARKIDSQNPQEAANGYKNSDNSTFFGYEEIN